MTNKQITVGCIEWVSFPGLGLEDIVAKIDTGAYSGALHCTNIKVVRRGAGRRRVLKFTPHGHPELAQETTKFHETHVRSALGNRKKRFLIDVELILKGKSYQTVIGLSDRSEMRRPALIGRRFLRENNIVVDVRVNAEYDDEGESAK